MLSGRLPAQIDPIRLADEGVRLRGEVPGAELARLREAGQAADPSAPVTIDLQFEHTAHGVRLMHGTIRTTLETICQRCLGPMELEVRAEPYFALLTPGEAPGGAPEEAETLVVEGPFSLNELAEDELLLALPMIPVHGHGECRAPGAKGAPPVPETRPNPFAQLRGLKGKD